MTRWRLTIEYDGRPFMGWQGRTRGRGPEPSRIRTSHDGGGTRSTPRAHRRRPALAMSAHADIAKTLTAHRLRDGLNALVRPDPIAILAAEPVADDWHARFSCIGRRYEYRILNRRAPPALGRGHVWHIAVPLDVEAMIEGAAYWSAATISHIRSVQCNRTARSRPRPARGHPRRRHIRSRRQRAASSPQCDRWRCLGLVGGAMTRPNQGRARRPRTRRARLNATTADVLGRRFIGNPPSGDQTRISLAGGWRGRPVGSRSARSPAQISPPHGPVRVGQRHLAASSDGVNRKTVSNLLVGVERTGPALSTDSCGGEAAKSRSREHVGEPPSVTERAGRRCPCGR